MKIIVVILFIMFPVAVTAQNQGMAGNSMEKMMQLMQEMEQCMAKVDQVALEEFEEEAERFGEEIEELCKKGDRKKAQKKAIAFGKKAMKSPALIQVQKCSKITKGLELGQSDFSFEDQFDFSNKHICDE